MKLFRNIVNGKVYMEPLPEGKFLPLKKNTCLYSLRKFEAPIIREDSEWLVVVGKG